MLLSYTSSQDSKEKTTKNIIKSKETYFYLHLYTLRLKEKKKLLLGNNLKSYMANINRGSGQWFLIQILNLIGVVSWVHNIQMRERKTHPLLLRQCYFIYYWDNSEISWGFPNNYIIVLYLHFIKYFFSLFQSFPPTKERVWWKQTKFTSGKFPTVNL